jgi:hypothetical protein
MPKTPPFYIFHPKKQPVMNGIQFRSYWPAYAKIEVEVLWKQLSDNVGQFLNRKRSGKVGIFKIMEVVKKNAVLQA